MYRAKLISANFEESTMEFDIEDQEFMAKKGDYVIMPKEEFEELSKEANEGFVITDENDNKILINIKEWEMFCDWRKTKGY